MTGLSLTRAQSGIWLAQQLEPESTVYNIAACVEIRGPVDLDRLASAVRQAISEAECLQVRIVGERQIVAPAHVEVPVLDVDDAWMSHGPPTTLQLGRRAVVPHRPDARRTRPRALVPVLHHIAIDGYGIVLITRRAADLLHQPRTVPYPSTLVSCGQ